jgi:hypothetical protein
MRPVHSIIVNSQPNIRVLLAVNECKAKLVSPELSPLFRNHLWDRFIDHVIASECPLLRAFRCTSRLNSCRQANDVRLEKGESTHSVSVEIRNVLKESHHNLFIDDRP